MSSPAFVYTESQSSLTSGQSLFADLGSAIADQPGFLNKTWLAGAGNDALGGFYAFDSVENAQAFATGYLPIKAKALGAPQSFRVFEGGSLEEASRDMNSMHFGGQLEQTPGAFVFTEVRTNVASEESAWRETNPELKAQPGLLGKTWLNSHDGKSLGGFYAFDTVENAREFAVNVFPGQASQRSAGFSSRVFDANKLSEASQLSNSPFFADGNSAES
jgi:hypothetical protein